MTKKIHAPTTTHPKTLIVGIQAPYNPVKNSESYFEEFKNLVHSNGIEYDQAIFMKLREIDPGNFITQGKLNELAELCKKEHIEEVIISEPLTSQQEKNLSDMLNARVFDRTQLILEIFEKGAHSAEGKTQVALAMLQHRKARLAGRGIHMAQQHGSIGTKGPGETQKEKETQHIEHLMVKLRRDLEKLEKVRQTQRKKRQQSNVPQISLIGYTNAGKSSILNALTKSNVSAADRLFETLDTTTRELYIDGQKKGVISDTVGFIQQLPHNLIEAFKSTLTELQNSDLLLIVIDAADPNWELHTKIVLSILGELDVEKPLLYVFNKRDKLSDLEQFENEVQRYHPHILISTLSLEGLEPLINYLRLWKTK